MRPSLMRRCEECNGLDAGSSQQPLVKGLGDDWFVKSAEWAGPSLTYYDHNL